MSKCTGWVGMDKYLTQEFKSIKREFSMIEAMFSFSVDVNNGEEGSIAGYSKLWGWSRNKVRRFITGIKSEKGHIKDSKRTQKGHPIHFIDAGLQPKKDSKRTQKGHKGDTTNKPKENNNTKEKIQKEILSFLAKCEFENYNTKTEAHERIIQEICSGLGGLGFTTSREFKVFNVSGGRNGFIDIRFENDEISGCIEVDSVVRKKSLQKLKISGADLNIQFIYTSEIEKNFNDHSEIWFYGRELFGSKRKNLKKELKDYLIEKISNTSFEQYREKLIEFVDYRMSLPPSSRYKTTKGIDGLLTSVGDLLRANLEPVACLDKTMEEEWRKPKPEYFGKGGMNGRKDHNSGFDQRTYEGTPESEIPWLNNQKVS